MKKGLFLSTCLIATLFTSCAGGGSKPTPTPTPGKTYNFSFTGEKCRINNQSSFSEEIKENESRIYTINVDEGRDLIASDVIIEGENVEFDEANCQIRISKMTSNVKVTATINDDIAFRFIGTNCKINNKSLFSERIPFGKTKVYQVTITDPTCTLLDGDLNILSGNKKAVFFDKNTKTITIYAYYTTTDITLTMKARHTYTFDFTGTNCKIGENAHFVSQIREDEAKEFDVTITEDYYLFENDITITGLGAHKVLYDWVDTKIVVDGMVGDVTIKATAQTHPTYFVGFSGINCKGKTPKMTQPETDFTIELSKKDKDNLVISLSYDKDKYCLPYTILVNYNHYNIGRPNKDYIYDREQGTITLLKKEPAIITIEAVDSSISASLWVKTNAENQEIAFNTEGENLTYLWGDGETSISPQHSYKNIDYYNIKIKGNLTKIGLANKENNDALLVIDIYSPNFLEIKDESFQNCNRLFSVGISRVKILGHRVFYRCENLLQVNIPNNSGLTTMGFSVFGNCSFASFALPSTVTVIDQYAFANCRSLANFIINDDSQLESIEYRAFIGCSTLGSIKLPHKLTTLGDESFAKAGLHKVDLTVFKDSDEKLPKLINASAFSETPKDMKIYVSSENVKTKLINDYGWQNYSAQITTDPIPVF